MMPMRHYGELRPSARVDWTKPFEPGPVKIDYDAVMVRMEQADALLAENLERILSVDRAWGMKAAFAEAIRIGLEHRETGT